jgi:hypothetical protein
MTRMLLAAAGSIAAIAVCAGGAQAQEWNSSGHRSGAFVGVPADGGSLQNGARFGFGCSGDRCRRSNRNRGGRTDVVLDWYGGEWAAYNNRSWEPTSYNDWWHEEPWRAYPAWMRRNQDCQRPWFSGDTLRC